MDKILEDIPQKTGIYKFFDKDKKILYIGKALNLKSRVSSYFKNSHIDRPHIVKMIPQICNVQTIVTENEVESMILESALIKKYKPKFNIEFKDDKSFAWIYISTKEKFPTVRVVRSIKKNEFKEGMLFGPYPKGKPVKRIFNYIRKLFPFCTCKNPKEPCLYYHLNLCPAPYHNKISPEDYRENINNIIKFLKGNKRNIVKNLKKDMLTYAEKLDFESAALLRDKIDDLEYLSQKITVSPFDSEVEYANNRYEKIRNSLITLSKQLNISRLQRIECFDVSNIQGKFAYGAMSVAINGVLESDEYRIFKIKNFSKPNDPNMLLEVVTRRLKNSKKPDLILLDGGITQLSGISKLLKKDIQVLAISKGKRLKKKRRDEFWILGKKGFENINIKFPYLLLQLRDEAHRFGVKYYRRSIAKHMKKSALDDIEGVGEKRKTLLLKNFDSVENIKRASFEEINSVLKNQRISQKIKAHKFD